ncbi:MAG: peptidase C14, partial [Sphaerospermopsis sp. SIO1G2]|nr:peptidase C14 [Sphaerospermopsis sp. SIO1G2]
AGFLAENCLLMTNSSPPVGDQSSHPTRDSILFFLDGLAVKSWLPQDYLWFFFSGYAVNYNDKDYLMPCDGNPDQVLDTGIEIRKILERIANANLNSVFIFDINRAFGTQANTPVGEDTLNAAKELNISVMLSCQPQQFSHESQELGHGFFTAALLAALNSCPGGNLNDLSAYVNSLTPQFCQHHWRPIQNPAIFIAENAAEILPFSTPNTILEVTENNLENQSANIFPEESFAVLGSAIPQTPATQPSKYKAWWADNYSSQFFQKTTITNSSGNDNSKSQSTLATSTELNTGSRFIPGAAKNYAQPQSQSSQPIWQQFILWGGGSMFIFGLLTTFLLLNQASFRFNKVSTSLNQNTDTTANSGLSSNPPTQPPEKIDQIPETNSQEHNQAISQLEKMSLDPQNASDLSQAIASAQTITPNQPSYQQAQANIQVWNQMILDLAEEKAQQRKYSDAIKTTELINNNYPIYSQVQVAIEKWQLEEQQYQNNQIILNNAQALIQTGKASTYNQAISVAQQINPQQPGFEIAQQYINQWSEEIFRLAKMRADQGEFMKAIDTASLIPDATIVYEDAQDAINKWRSQIQ